MSGSISVLQGTSFNKASSYLRRAGKEVQKTVLTAANSDSNYIIYNNVYNNYLSLYLEDKLEELKKFDIIDTIISLSKSLDQIVSVVLLDTLTVVQRGLIQYDDNNALKNEVEYLKKRIDEMKCKKKQFGGVIKTDVDVDVTLDVKYILYVKEFGAPINGLFDSRKLAKVIQKYNLYNI